VTQSQTCATFFKGKELAFAFGVSIAFERLGESGIRCMNQNFVPLHLCCVIEPRECACIQHIGANRISHKLQNGAFYGFPLNLYNYIL